jgi:hypothetical protein
MELFAYTLVQYDRDPERIEYCTRCAVLCMATSPKALRAFENNSKDRYANLKKLENSADEAMRSLLLVQNAMSSVKFEPERRNEMKAAVEEFKRTEKALKREKDAALKQACAAAEEAYEKYFDAHFVRFNALEPLEEDDLTQELRCVIA